MEDSQIKEVFKDSNTQDMLNAPVVDPNGSSLKDKEFLTFLIGLIDSGKVDLYKPESLINKPLYDTFDQKVQGEIDLEAINLLSALRDIEGLYKSGNVDSFQIENLVERVWNTKNRIENVSGDIFII
ncbi:hypothetical protein CVV38_02205 [Candidatus Peregrinibacteria bacterium HGW-Peregrinibacteria-1]|jgi:hypothetical protein|nr:MAG: hypothetical protein CVV38_02205 [Candidatus Peregrinibacteria bacterium HGW-Peregrinibacteria-1]